MNEPPKRFVSPIELRKIFNDNNYWDRLRAGEFHKKKLDDDHAKPRPRIPRCTRSQILAYIDENGNWIAVVHQFLKRDGTLGGGGRPDPKWLFHEGILYMTTED